jgi:lipopolysaccharide export system protein LptA
MPHTHLLALGLAALLAAAPAAAQTTEISLGGLRTDPDAPVQITADRLEADQDSGTAVFTGDVVVIQGQMVMAAPRVEVFYAADGSGTLERVHATGGVTLTSDAEAAEGEDAVYTPADTTVVMTGDVLLTQGTTTLAGQMLTADLSQGTGVMEGRVSMLIPAEAEAGQD